MNGPLATYIEDQLDTLAEWDTDAIVETLSITTEEILNIPEFRDRAKQWIQDNCP